MRARGYLATTFVVVASGLFAPPAEAEDVELPAPPLTVTLTPTATTSWTLKLANAGELPVRVSADVRLLRLEITPPAGYQPPDAKKGRGAKPPAVVSCALPSDAGPLRDDGPDLVIPGGRSWSTSFDPLYICFGDKERSALVRGATVTPHFGWAPARAHGKKAARPTPPFVASPVGAAVGKLGPVKELDGAAITLADDVEPAPRPAEDGATRPDLSVSLPRTLDAARGVDLAATVGLSNDTDHKIDVLFRSATVRFRVQGSSGAVTCGAVAPVSPIRELFATLAPKGKTSLAMLVDAACPSDTFAAPGVYRVFARVDTTQTTGRPLGIRSWDGVTPESAPLLVRVRGARRPTLSRPLLD